MSGAGAAESIGCLVQHAGQCTQKMSRGMINRFSTSKNPEPCPVAVANPDRVLSRRSVEALFHTR